MKEAQIIDFHSINDDEDKLIYKRQLLNIELSIYIKSLFESYSKNAVDKLNKIRREIKQITKKLGDDYQDEYTLVMRDVKRGIIKLLSKQITTPEEAYEHSKRLEDEIIKKRYLIIDRYDEEIAALLERYEELGYTPKNIIKTKTQIQINSCEQNKMDYINQVLYNLLTEKTPVMIVVDITKPTTSVLRSEINRKDPKSNKVKRKYGKHSRFIIVD